MPSSYRADLKDGVVATRSKEGAVAIVPVDTFEEFAAKAMDQPLTQAARRKARAMFTVAEHLKLDGQGRILLSAEMRKHAGLEEATEVVVAGVFKSIEIWHPDAFDQDFEVSTNEYQGDEEVPGF